MVLTTPCWMMAAAPRAPTAAPTPHAAERASLAELALAISTSAEVSARGERGCRRHIERGAAKDGLAPLKQIKDSGEIHGAGELGDVAEGARRHALGGASVGRQRVEHSLELLKGGAALARGHGRLDHLASRVKGL
eukprot:scaffold3767_cov114-Isochrysis_galbana.AAC.26